MSRPSKLGFHLYQRFSVVGRRCSQQSGSGESRQTNTPPDPPSDCCMRGCTNCVWVKYAEELAELYKDRGQAAFKAIKEIPDPNLKSFVELELKLKFGSTTKEMLTSKLSPRFVKVGRRTPSGEKAGIPGRPPIGTQKKQALFTKPSASSTVKETNEEHIVKNTTMSHKLNEESLISSPAQQPVNSNHNEDKTVRKVRRKKRKKKSKVSKPPTLLTKRDHLQDALSYLRLWYTDQKTWSFKKKLQNHLLDNMFDKLKIKSADFKILLRYLEGLQGGVRKRTVERSQAVVDAYDSSRSDSEDDNGSRVLKHQYKRAVEVLRVLA